LELGINPYFAIKTNFKYLKKHIYIMTPRPIVKRAVNKKVARPRARSSRGKGSVTSNPTERRREKRRKP